MLVKPAVAAAGLLAASTNAFLLPPTITEVDAELVAPLVSVPDNGAESVDVKVNCPGCPVIIHGHRVPKFMEDMPHHLDISLSIEHHAEGTDRLLANGFELYPNPDPLHEVFSATPRLDNPPWAAKGRGKWGPPWGKWGHHKDGEEHGHHRRPGGPFGRKGPLPQPLGFSLSTGTLVKDAGSELELLEVDLKIIEVGGQFISGIPELQVKLIKDPAGHLTIGKVEKVESEAPAVAPATPQQCTSFLCKWMASIFGSKGCHGSKSGSAPVQEVEQDAKAEAPHMPSEPARHMNAPERSWGRLFKNIAAHIILPVLIGIVAGVSVSLIGMVVGTLIVSAWRTFVRRPSHHHHHHHHHHRRHHSRKSVQMDPAVVEEKQALMDNVEPEDAPPAYEDEDVKKADNQV